MFNKTFFSFFFGFVAIIAVAFGVLVAANQMGKPVDTVAHPK
jgi:hypothetical protein